MFVGSGEFANVRASSPLAGQTQRLTGVSESTSLLYNRPIVKELLALVSQSRSLAVALAEGQRAAKLAIKNELNVLLFNAARSGPFQRHINLNLALTVRPKSVSDSAFALLFAERSNRLQFANDTTICLQLISSLT